jgi:glucosamine-6-phosphate deaminase
MVGQGIARLACDDQLIDGHHPHERKRDMNGTEGLIREFTVDGLKVTIWKDRQAMGRAAARAAATAIEAAIGARQQANVIFAAAPSQQEFLQALRTECTVDWQWVNAFHMDEYIGLPGSHPLSLASFLRRSLFDRVACKSVQLLDGMAADIQSEAKCYAALLKYYAVDVLCAGIGDNGHLAFNDPHVARFDDPEMVKVVDIDEVSKQQQANGAGFGSVDAVPSLAFTVTIPALLAAGTVICTVPFKAKARAVREALHGPLSERCPASALRTHRNAGLFLDVESAALL